jgi:hypothetical protein
MPEPKTYAEVVAESVDPPKRGIIPVESGTALASLHDQSLSTILGGGMVWALVTFAGATPPAGAAAAIVYASAGGLGGYIGSVIPGKYRAALQYAALMLAGLYGIELGTGQ